jgi:phage repressor protein C with HTH and peptisase S24 domain
MAMLTHAQIWTALDRLAAHAGLSPSGLAKRAGLDPTTFNKSKRITTDGRARWPSTESVAKSLDATGVSFDDFVALVSDGPPRGSRPIPLVGFAEAGGAGHFDDAGFPAGKDWDEIAFPQLDDDHAYALEISGPSLQPAYRDGTIIVVSPAAPIRRGDRIVIMTRTGDVSVAELKRKTVKTIELKPLNDGENERAVPLADLAWIARILWASQ